MSTAEQKPENAPWLFMFAGFLLKYMHLNDEISEMDGIVNPENSNLWPHIFLVLNFGYWWMNKVYAEAHDRFSGYCHSSGLRTRYFLSNHPHTSAILS